MLRPMALPFDHLISAKQLTTGVLADLFPVADAMDDIWTSGIRSDMLNEKIVALLFYEPSSRTMLSFQAATQGLSAGMILAQGEDSSSFKKGETIEDTIRVVARYSDCIVMRHPEAGSAERAAKVSHVPFINAGDGPNEHPTQALLDAYTIQKKCGQLKDLHIAFSMDAKHSRTIRSLAILLSQYPGNRFTFITPDELKIDPALLQELTDAGVKCEEASELKAGLDADILYMNRLQKERFKEGSDFEKYRKKYCVTAAMLKGKDVLVLDPLPRVGEIAEDVDDLPNAGYFDQVRNGVLVRMALLKMLLAK